MSGVSWRGAGQFRPPVSLICHPFWTSVGADNLGPPWTSESHSSSWIVFNVGCGHHSPLLISVAPVCYCLLTRIKRCTWSRAGPEGPEETRRHPVARRDPPARGRGSDRVRQADPPCPGRYRDTGRRADRTHDLRPDDAEPGPLPARPGQGCQGPAWEEVGKGPSMQRSNSRLAVRQVGRRKKWSRRMVP